MTTTTASPIPSAHSPLPALTPAERCAALAWIERGESTLRDVAAQLHLAADDLLDILTQPHVAAYIEAAENIIQLRASILARYDDIEARQSLVEVAKNPEADHAIRLRAAITVLQGPPPRRLAMPTHGPASPGAPPPDRSTGAPRTPSAPPANTPPAPAQANSASPHPPLPAPANAAHLAAGAPVARHDRLAAADPDRHIDHRLVHPAASPAIPARPP